MLIVIRYFFITKNIFKCCLKFNIDFIFQIIEDFREAALQKEIYNAMKIFECLQF